MKLSLHNSLSRQVEAFEPQDPQHVTMYVCGPTVYDTPHLGNARPAVVFDVLYRLLGFLYPEVSYARNFTDIDDKIIDRAKASGIDIHELTSGTIHEYEEVVAALGCLKPTLTPRATSWISEMLKMIGKLVASGNAYESAGHVLFDVSSFPEHGILSRHDQEDLRATGRVAPADYKRHPSDFVLWKPSSADQPGWDSPYGRGRPGWHIECSAMIAKAFGPTIDIHGGGGDLRFPHHDCEISQSQCAHGAPLARYWLHNGMVLSNGKKMAKSEGNFTTPGQALDAGISGDAIRLALLSAHYRQPLDWADEGLQQAERTVMKWRNALLPFKGRVRPQDTDFEPEPVLMALCSDLNTPLAISAVHEMIDGVNALASDPGKFDRAIVPQTMKAVKLLGVLGDITDAPIIDTELVQALIDERNEARAAKDYERADNLRRSLTQRGIQLRDQGAETVWWCV